jgi:hypothetical protein
MQATLMNVGDNARVISDKSNSRVTIEIGQMIETNIHDVHYNMISRAAATDTLLVVPKGIKRSPRLHKIMELMQVVATGPYDEVLSGYATVIEQGDIIRLRPTRTEMRLNLREQARAEVLRASKKVNIREQGDEVTRQNPKTIVTPPSEQRPEKTIKLPPSETQEPKVVGPGKISDELKQMMTADSGRGVQTVED